MAHLLEILGDLVIMGLLYYLAYRNGKKAQANFVDEVNLELEPYQAVVKTPITMYGTASEDIERGHQVTIEL